MSFEGEQEHHEDQSAEFIPRLEDHSQDGRRTADSKLLQIHQDGNEIIRLLGFDLNYPRPVNQCHTAEISLEIVNRSPVGGVGAMLITVDTSLEYPDSPPVLLNAVTANHQVPF
jgi:hypothetical protein